MQEATDGLLVLGSTLAVHSSFRLARLAVKEGRPLGIITFGQTRADDLIGSGVTSAGRVSKAEASASAVLEHLLVLGLQRGEQSAMRAMAWLCEHSRPELHPVLVRAAVQGRLTFHSSSMAQWEGQDEVDGMRKGEGAYE